MPRSWWQECDWPLELGGTGSLHDVQDQEELPRLYGMKSVSKAAAWALHHSPRQVRRRQGVGFAGHVRVKRK